MIHVKFKNMNKSEFARLSASKRVQDLIEKFEDLSSGRVVVTLEMHNSPHKAGPDLFTVCLQIFGSRYSGIRVQKSDSNLFVALAEVIDHMLEVLNRAGDKARVRKISSARKFARNLTYAKSG